MNQFDFSAYNKLLYGAGSGLKLHLALQLLRDCAITFERFNNPLEDDLRGCIKDLKEIQVKAKADAAARSDKKGMLAADGQQE